MGPGLLWAHREGDEELGVKREVAVTSRATTAAERWLGDAKDNHFTSADYDALLDPKSRTGRRWATYVSNLANHLQRLKDDGRTCTPTPSTIGKPLALCELGPANNGELQRNGTFDFRTVLPLRAQRPFAWVLAWNSSPGAVNALKQTPHGQS